MRSRHSGIELRAASRSSFSLEGFRKCPESPCAGDPPSQWTNVGVVDRAVPSKQVERKFLSTLARAEEHERDVIEETRSDS